MDYHIKEYYSQASGDSPHGFHKVISLDESPHISWEDAKLLVPNLCKGWYELSSLNPKDRVEFVCDYWLTKMPYHHKFSDFLINFFKSLDDICVFVIQRKFDDPYEANIVYSLKEDAGFFRGSLPASTEQIENLQKAFPQLILPPDYIDFLQIHNGFCKTTDSTGIIPAQQVPETCKKFQAVLESEEVLTTNRGVEVNPKSLIPFYESFGMPFFQCFWAEWYPEQEMGNVYYSGLTRTISDVEGKDPSSEGMAFPTFTDWLMFYMERFV